MLAYSPTGMKTAQRHVSVAGRARVQTAKGLVQPYGHVSVSEASRRLAARSANRVASPTGEEKGCKAIAPKGQRVRVCEAVAAEGEKASRTALRAC
jgi:hypothetical protein